jgi:hypothetical protein
MIIDIITSICMSFASIVYACKNIRHLSCFYGMFSCTQKSDQDNEIKALEEQLNIAIMALKKIQKTPRILLANNELKDIENNN